MNEPLVSVLTPSFEQGAFIGDCLRSVAGQSYPNIEHIVMDGGSTDNTVEALRQAGETISWRSERDRGQSHALNKALAMSQGRFIGWVNSDDAYADRRAVETAVRLFEQFPEVGVVYGHTLLIDARNHALQFLWAPRYSAGRLRRFTPFGQPAAFLRRSVLPEPFLKEELHYVMDRDLWLQLVDQTEFRRLDLVVAVDRHHGERKVMDKRYTEERERYNQATGQPASTSMTRMTKIAWRLRGTLDIPQLWSDLDPAFDLRLDSTLALTLRQLLVPRRFMGRSADSASDAARVG